jgi:hypothetical protein
MLEIGNIKARRIAIRAALVAALAATAFGMYSIGKEHNVLLDNRAAVIDGVEYAPVEALTLAIDGVKKNDVKAGGRVAHKMIGRNHKIAIGITRSDKTVEKTIERGVRFDADMRKWMISLPALAAGAPDIYIPTPAAAPPPPPPSDESSPPAGGEGFGGDGFGIDGAPVETIPGTGL